MTITPDHLAVYNRLQKGPCLIFDFGPDEQGPVEDLLELGLATYNGTTVLCHSCPSAKDGEVIAAVLASLKNSDPCATAFEIAFHILKYEEADIDRALAIMQVQGIVQAVTVYTLADDRRR